MFDRIIMSADRSPKYFGFWQIQVLAHKTFFPDVKLTLAVLKSPINKVESDGVYDRLVNMLLDAGVDDVQLHAPAYGVPEENQAKLLRYYAAAQWPQDVSIICDIDTVPLTDKYIRGLAEVRIKDKLLAVGREVYLGTHDGKFPAHHIAGEGYLFELLYNTYGKTFAEVVGKCTPMSKYDHKEDVRNFPHCFSDESLNRALIELNCVPMQHIERKIDIHKQWIDRAWWDKLDTTHLNNDMYIEANLLRPFAENRAHIQPIIDFLESKNKWRYDGKT